MQDISTVLERVNALLNLAKNNTNENERGNAQRIAQKLISKFQISQEALENVECKNSDPYVTEEVFSGHKARIVWKERLIGKICQVNGCFHLINNWHNPREGVKYTAHGKTSSIKIVKLLIDFIINQIEWLAKNSNLKGKSEMTSFKLGCAQKVCERLEEGRIEAIAEYKKENNIPDDACNTAIMKFDNALVLAKNDLESSGVQFQTIKSRKPTIRINAYNEGKKAGDMVDLRAPNKALKG
jgi:hypothetical protein